MSAKKRIRLILTGGTIEKTYDELSGVLSNRVSVLDYMLSQLQLEGVSLDRVSLMNKDSRDMSEEDHEMIALAAIEATDSYDGVVVLHGTDRLSHTGERIAADASLLKAPVVLTGAMRPWILRNTDARQNLTEALLAVMLLDSGVYVAMHNNVLQFPGVIKDRERGRFVRST